MAKLKRDKLGECAKILDELMMTSYEDKVKRANLSEVRCTMIEAMTLINALEIIDNLTNYDLTN